MACISRVFMGSDSSSGKARKIAGGAGALVFLLLVCASPGAAGQGISQNQNQNQGALSQNPDQGRYPDNEPNFSKPSQKQRQAILDLNFKKLKKHAEDLADLANSLQKEIEKSNENVLSLEIVKKAEQAEKLARQIREEAKGY